MSSFHDFKTKNNQGQEYSFAQLRDQVVLIVNVASRCGYTPQYTGLESLQRQFKDRGFAVIGFPCNQFGAQEPGQDAEIAEFCRLNYNVSFPLMAKTDVNGANASPIFEYLKSEAPGILGTETIKWNFTKFLVSKKGKVLGRFAPTTEPKDLAPHIEQALKSQNGEHSAEL